MPEPHSNVCVLQEQGFNGVNVGCLNRQGTLQKSTPSKNIIHSVESTNSVSTNDTSSATGPAIGYRCLQPFGFIKRVENISKYHLNDFSRSVVAGSNKEWVQKAHKIVVDSGTSNYKSAPILAKTDLNLKLWAEILKDYHDPQLLDYLRFGFPLCVNYDAFQHAPSTVNHLSATRFPDDVNIYFSTELAHNSIAGPFGSVPFANFHVSPLLTRPKNNDSRRVIVNLSYPEGQSVNSSIESEIYDHEIFIPFIEGSSLCPVTALTTMFHMFPAPPDSPAFIVPRGGGYVPLLAFTVRQTLAKIIMSLQLQPSAFTFHAFRRSGATFSFNNNVAFQDIRLQGSWKSDAIYKYFQSTNASHKVAESFQTLLHHV